jgi:integrase
VVLGLGYFCGLRRYEIIGLKPEQLTTKWGRITNFVRKGGGEDTLRWDSLLSVYEEKLPKLLVSRDLFVQSLDRILTQRAGRPLLVPWANEDAVNKKLSYWCRSVGVEHITPHQLRHSAATNLVEAGVPLHIVREVMNHQSIDVTLRYVRTRGDELDAWLKGR